MEGSLDRQATSARLCEDPSSYKPVARNAITLPELTLASRGEIAMLVNRACSLELLHPISARSARDRFEGH
jgi:hypothetical protein